MSIHLCNAVKPRSLSACVCDWTSLLRTECCWRLDSWRTSKSDSNELSWSERVTVNNLIHITELGPIHFKVKLQVSRSSLKDLGYLWFLSTMEKIQKVIATFIWQFWFYFSQSVIFSELQVYNIRFFISRNSGFIYHNFKSTSHNSEFLSQNCKFRDVNSEFRGKKSELGDVNMHFLIVRNSELCHKMTILRKCELWHNSDYFSIL